ncbi:hypothetical protein CLOP_g14316 [Closterium sp. NIES-67]|nr:hypothetical protein CLOP_g14316 [Closterium sp. NIES-67]
MPCKGHGEIEGVAIAVALTTTKVVAGLGTSGGMVALVQEEEIPALIWESTKKELGEVKAGSGVQGECNGGSAAGVTVSARSGETDWETAHKRLGHGQYINTLAEKYSLQEEQTVVTPLPSEFKLIKAAEGEGVECEDQRQFQSMVGSLLYAAVHTRPDISFA